MGYAAIYIPEFPSLAWLRLEKDARSRAAAVVEGIAPLERVVSFNRAAKELGLEHGMTKTQADTSGQVTFRSRSIPEECAALDTVFEAAEGFSPRVQIVASPINEYASARQPAAILLVDQTGTDMLFGDGLSFAGKLRSRLQALEFPSNVAVAPNAEASVLLARSYSGALSVDSNEVRAKLAPLPVSVLRCDPSLLATLSRWGIKTLSELSALPETALVSRIGQQGKRLQRLALGVENHLLVPKEPELTLTDQVSLDGPLESLESLLFIVSPMLDKLLKQAVNHAYAVRSLTVTLSLEKLPPHGLHIRPAVPVQTKDLLLKLLTMKLQSDPPKAAILGVTLSADPAIPQLAQRGLFQSQFPEPDKLDLLIARLTSIAGKENVGSPALTDSHRSDEFLIEPFQPSMNGNGTFKPPRSVRAALRRFRPPQPVRVLVQSSRPTAMYWKGERFHIDSAIGPWRLNGYWWDGRHWDTEEWDILTIQPRQSFLLRQEPAKGTWYIEGQYD